MRSQMLRTLYSFISKGLLRFSYWAPYFIVCTNNDDESELRSQSRHFLQQLANAYYVNLPGKCCQTTSDLLLLLRMNHHSCALTLSLSLSLSYTDFSLDCHSLQVESFLQSDETLPMLLYFLAVHSEFSASHPDILSAFLK